MFRPLHASLCRAPITRAQCAQRQSFSNCRIKTPGTQFRCSRNYSDRPEDAIKSLQAAFQTPGSPFYLAPGELGPAEPHNWPEHDPDAPYMEADSHVNAEKNSASAPTTSRSGSTLASGWPHNNPAHAKSRALAAEHGRENEYDLESMVEWPVAWGEQDQFRHVNNVSFARYFETARVRVMQAFEPYMTSKTFRQFMDGTGMGLVVKSVSIEYRRPVTFPDSLVIMSKLIDIDERKASFGLKQEAYSLNQNTVVARCTSVQVMYDFQNLQKGIMTDEVKRALHGIVGRSVKS
ncbi:hypothetical protein NliqN6_2368 [Naganishia liquefaciens]|uniref:Acyl-CoA thioesterase n=1 Tax=Naganishia liquefaciens TaxID=104408 RepID=A0A8H3TR89_9TREE|nr:hypothetical protein NliqN6_2368 [Naganishia liquefaciens]